MDVHITKQMHVTVSETNVEEHASLNELARQINNLGFHTYWYRLPGGCMSFEFTVEEGHQKLSEVNTCLGI